MTSDDSADEGHSRPSRVFKDNSQHRQPEASPPRRRRKSKRKTMGIHRPEYVVKGTDPFDYEQKFPEDKRHEELGPMARVWRTYLEECTQFDLEMVEGWRDGLDVLLVFAGLFSAVVTTFVAQTSQSLQVDYGQVTATLLIELIDVQRSAANGSVVNTIPRSDLTFRPSTSDSWVNGLWFTSLSLSLTTALFAVLTKQWIHQYMSVPSGTPRDRCRLRQFRYMGLQQWGVDLIVGLLPVLMSISLAVFLLGLVLFIIPLRVSIASVVGAIAFISFAAYLITNLLPILYPSCPYKTPLSQYIFPLYTYIMNKAAFFNRIIPPIFITHSPPASTEPAVHVLKDAEIAAVKHYADETDVHALSWLYSMSSNPSVQSIVIQSISALPLKSLESLSHQIAGLSDTCHSALHELIQTLDRDLGQEGQIDRFSRVFARLPGRYIGTFFNHDTLKKHLSHDVYLQLQCCLFVDATLSYRNEIRQQLLPWSRLTLQPIMWAHLLHKFLSIHSEEKEDIHDVIQHFFPDIPRLYWEADFVCPPPVFEYKEIKVFNNTVSSEAVGLGDAIEKHLYPWVADIIQSQLNVTDSIFNPESPDEYPSPQDPRLRFLLTLAGSPSVQWRTGHEDIFETVIKNIATFIKISLWNSSSSDGLTPITGLTNHRHAVLKLLYTLLLSDQSGEEGMPMDRQRAILTFFLCMVKSTYPLPLFIVQDWCTPDLASKFVCIVFKDGAWAERSHHVPYLLIPHLFCFSPIMNEAFKYAAAECLFDQTVKKLEYHSDESFNHYYFLSHIIQAFVVGLSSSKLDPHISQKFLAYLFKPDILFAICIPLLGSGSSEALCDLACLCPNNSAWPICLQRLQEYVYSASLSDQYNIPGTLADLKAFLEGGGVGPFGSKLLSEAIAQENDSPPTDSLKDSWQNAWHRVRQYITGKDTAHEDVELSNISGLGGV
ncbi:uncharacterized protein ARMOST_07532 [Armillaria ostoyae]|uniref:DUF6535 domain-containing protein n=1 Tax=Armillaria ostoyae TaxID=47428 RepID=A0A284R664_ARMOS|nr:uncharacterized protein ARMOST_07532 [Armillaria ostoyae]